MGKPIITLQNVSKEFNLKERYFTALKHIDLNIVEGEFLAITGKSGSGKSTLLNMLTGIDRPTQGTIQVNGININHLNESKLAQWRGINIGIVFQFFQLIPTLTIGENLMLAMEFVNTIPKKERLNRTAQLLEQVGILEQIDKMPATLSGGEQQRAAIARALANNPSIIVADEPTGNLDSKTTNSINTLFSSLASSGKTVIVVTHEKESVQKYHRTITISDGSIIAENHKNKYV
ncbi:ABC transporter ATP-binding protein [Mariniflexile sp. HMF6888]|uniref:ABC transporter ATP-binding protein n=1 Tax=Mariniflexile sp. HMF6888 TaxID=3373086 RepID=UPI00379CBAF8